MYSDLPGWESFQRSSPTVASRTSLQPDPLLLSLITLYFLVHHIWNLAPYLCSPGKLFLLHPLFPLLIPSFQFCLLSTLLLFVIWGLACYSFLHSAHPDLPVTAVTSDDTEHICTYPMRSLRFTRLVVRGISRPSILFIASKCLLNESNEV